MDLGHGDIHTTIKLPPASSQQELQEQQEQQQLSSSPQERAYLRSLASSMRYEYGVLRSEFARMHPALASSPEAVDAAVQSGALPQVCAVLPLPSTVCPQLLALNYCSPSTTVCPQLLFALNYCLPSTVRPSALNYCLPSTNASPEQLLLHVTGITPLVSPSARNRYY